MPSLKLKARLNKARCPYCHDDLSGELVECESCSASHHSECWDDHGACATCKNVNANQCSSENLERYRDLLDRVEDSLPFPIWLCALLVQILIFIVMSIPYIIMAIGEIVVSITAPIFEVCVKVLLFGALLFILIELFKIL